MPGVPTLAVPTIGPPQLNFAGYCIWCSAHRCHAVTCVERHSSSVWGICERCDGLGFIEPEQETCGCAFGLAERVHTGRTIDVAV